MKLDLRNFLSGRRLLVTGMAAVVVTGGAAGTALAAGHDDDRPTKAPAVTADQAMAAALKAVPGAVTSVELEHENTQPAWEVEIAGQDGAQHELLIDGTGGTVTKNTTDDGGHEEKSEQGKHDDHGDDD